MIEPQIIFEDNHLVVAIKPAGYLSQADQTDHPDMLTWIKADLKIRYQKPGDVFLGLVHRLDQPVSGLMVFARTSKAASRLSEQVRSHQMGKYYLAVVSGKPEPESGHWVDHLLKDHAANRVRTVRAPEGQFAALDYQVLLYDKQHHCSLVRIQLETGRSHQIRVQFASRGWPLLGDLRYGSRISSYDQLALFAERLSFEHPTKKERLDFSIAPSGSAPWNYFEILSELNK